MLTVGGTVVNGTTNHTLDEIWELIDLTTKDSSKAKEWTTGEYEGGITMEGKLDESDAYTYSELRTAANLRTAAAVVFGRFEAGGVIYSGNAFIHNLSQSAAKNGEHTWSASLKFTGFPTESTYATT